MRASDRRQPEKVTKSFGQESKVVGEWTLHEQTVRPPGLWMAHTFMALMGL